MLNFLPACCVCMLGGLKLGKGQGIAMRPWTHSPSLWSHNKSWGMQVAHEDPITSYKKYIHSIHDVADALFYRTTSLQRISKTFSDKARHRL